MISADNKTTKGGKTKTATPAKPTTVKKETPKAAKAAIPLSKPTYNNRQHLHELAQKLHIPKPEYSEMPHPARRGFTSTCRLTIQEQTLFVKAEAPWTGDPMKTKKIAQEEAARLMLQKITTLNLTTPKKDASYSLEDVKKVLSESVSKKSNIQLCDLSNILRAKFPGFSAKKFRFKKFINLVREIPTINIIGNMTCVPITGPSPTSPEDKRRVIAASGVAKPVVVVKKGTDEKKLPEHIVEYVIETLETMPQGRVKLSIIGVGIKERFPTFVHKQHGFKKFIDAMRSIEGVEVKTHSITAEWFVELMDKTRLKPPTHSSIMISQRSWNKRGQRGRFRGNRGRNRGRSWQDRLGLTFSFNAQQAQQLHQPSPYQLATRTLVRPNSRTQHLQQQSSQHATPTYAPAQSYVSTPAATAPSYRSPVKPYYTHAAPAPAHHQQYPQSQGQAYHQAVPAILKQGYGPASYSSQPQYHQPATYQRHGRTQPQQPLQPRGRVWGPY